MLRTWLLIILSLQLYSPFGLSFSLHQRRAKLTDSDYGNVVELFDNTFYRVVGKDRAVLIEYYNP